MREIRSVGQIGYLGMRKLDLDAGYLEELSEKNHCPAPGDFGAHRKRLSPSQEEKAAALWEAQFDCGHFLLGEGGVLVPNMLSGQPKVRSKVTFR